MSHRVPLINAQPSTEEIITELMVENETLRCDLITLTKRYNLLYQEVTTAAHTEVPADDFHKKRSTSKPVGFYEINSTVISTNPIS